MSYAFILSLILHAFIGFIVLLSIEKNQTNEVSFFDEKNLISLTFGSPQGSSSKSSGPKGSPKSNSTKNDTKSFSTQPVKPDSEQGSSSSQQVASGNSGSSGTSDSRGGTAIGEGIAFGEAIENYKEPLYPKLAIRRGIEGDLEVLINVSSDGVVQSVQLSRSSGHDLLDQAALTAIKEWRFKPRNSAYKVTKKVVFKLR